MMQYHLSLLLSDYLVYGLLLCLLVSIAWMWRRQQWRAQWRRVFQRKLAMIAAVVLSVYALVGLMDSLHIEFSDHQQSTQVLSVLDMVLSPLGQRHERTYSAPFSIHSFSQSMTMNSEGQSVMHYPRLQYMGKHLHSKSERLYDIVMRIFQGAVIGLLTFMMVMGATTLILAGGRLTSWRQLMLQIYRGQTEVAWRTAMVTLLVIWLLIAIAGQLIFVYAIFGTDKVGSDVFYLAIKSIRTGLLIGTLTTLLILPFALILGMAAGYFRGWVDDAIQYCYTTLSSIPGVLLISAMVLVLDVYITRHAALFPTLAQRADARLLALCFILGITSWASLCRLLRAETLKVRQLEFVQAAKAFGVRHGHILLRHIMPNVMHIVIITLVLDFSGLVLAEAVLSYIGVGVDPSMISWGNMINSSRLELAREPAVWWPLIAALVFMFILVLAANIFADAVRDAFDPRLHQN